MEVRELKTAVAFILGRPRVYKPSVADIRSNLENQSLLLLRM